MIPFQSHQTHSKTFLFVNSGLAIVWAGSPRLDYDLFRLLFSYLTHFSSPVHPLQKWVDFVTFQQRIADINPVQKVLCQFVWHPYIELLLETSLMQMVPNGFLANPQFLGNEISARMPVRLDDLHDFIDIFDDWPTMACLIFDAHITKTESLEPPLCCCIRYCIGSINSTNFFGRLLRLFTLVVVVLKNVLNFLFFYLHFGTL